VITTAPVMRSVRINAGSSIDVIHVIDRLDDMSEDIKTELWFTSQEMEEILRDCRRTVQMMQQDGGLILLNDEDNNDKDKDDIGVTARTATSTKTSSSDTDMTTTRGLEYCTAEGFDITSSTSQETIRLVLAEQDRQRNEHGAVDPVALASVIGQTSRHRQRVSHLMGMKDARSVYGDSDDRQWTTTNPTGAATRSGSFSSKRESRRERVQRSGSFGTLERARRRRGSRGAIDRCRALADAAATNAATTTLNDRKKNTRVFT
jgi:hypothetical protein